MSPTTLPQESLTDIDSALEANATCYNCGRDFHAHCFERGADCGMFFPVIETSAEESTDG